MLGNSLKWNSNHTKKIHTGGWMGGNFSQFKGLLIKVENETKEKFVVKFQGYYNAVVVPTSVFKQLRLR